MQSLIEGGPLALDLARRALEHVAADEAPGTWVERKAVRLLAPLPQPVQMRDFLCFEQHLKQSFQSSMELVAAQAPEPEQTLKALQASGRFDVPQIWYEIPIYYKCNRFSVVGPDHDVRWPGYANLLDYELELAAVIGTRGVDIPAEKARNHIFGFTIFNDVSARDYQTREMQGMLGPAKGKDFDTGNVLGPCIATADEIDALQANDDRAGQRRGVVAGALEQHAPPLRGLHRPREPVREHPSGGGLRLRYRGGRLRPGAEALPLAGGRHRAGGFRGSVCFATG